MDYINLFKYIQQMHFPIPNEVVEGDQPLQIQKW